MKWNVGTKIATGFGVILVVFFAVGAASFQATSELISASDLRRHTYILLGHLDEPLPLLRRAELARRTYFLTDDAQFLEEAQSAEAKIVPPMREVRRLTQDNPSQQRRLDVMDVLLKQRVDFSNETVASFRSQGQKAALDRVSGDEESRLNQQIASVIGQMQSEEEMLLKERTEQADRNGQQAQWTNVIGTLAALTLALLAGILITRSISRPLQQLTAFAERITVGDIRVSVPAGPRSDEVGVLARAFDRMTLYLRSMAESAERLAAGDLRTAVTPQSPDDVLGNAFVRMTSNLRSQIGGMVDAANVLGASASEIVASTTQLASSASESAAAVAQTTATVEEVRQTAQVASQKARHVSDSAQKAVQSSQTGRKSAEDVGLGMQHISQQMEAITASMGRLSEHSQTIGQIIATVEDLAVQSNLLSVNAAIEAAKAGEHGKGFGVVAQEVKSLAAQSRQATNQVRTILGDVQKATASAVMATGNGSQAVEAGGRQSEAASESIKALAGSVNEAAQAATQIAASSQQQLVGVDQVAGAMESIRQASSQNMVSAKQLETAARNLNDLGQRLKQLVASYSL